MEYQKAPGGRVVYEIQRVYAGDAPLTELIVRRLVQKYSENPAIDAGRDRDLYCP